MEFEKLIEMLDLKPHPEGGYFKEVYRSLDIVNQNCLPRKYKTDTKPIRNFCTSIYYLLARTDVSVFHRLKSDEIWHFYKGSPVRLHILDEQNNNYSYYDLGIHSFQYTIYANLWFSAEVLDKNSYSLLGCTVSPGFEFEDFQIAKREYLLEKFPLNIEIINRFTKS